MDTYVMPVTDVLSDTGYVWESQLFKKGWNELPHPKKKGRIVGTFSLLSGEIVFDIYWLGVNHTTTNVFPDEVYKVEGLS